MAAQALIDKLRAHSVFNGYCDIDEVAEIEDLLYKADAQEVYESFSEGGRWSNYKTAVHRVESEEGDEFFFEEVREVPSTEFQEGGYFSYEFNEVRKMRKTVTVYE